MNRIGMWLVVGLMMISAGCTKKPTATAPPAPATTAPTTSAAAATPAPAAPQTPIEKAQALLREMVDAYQAAPTLFDTTHTTTEIVTGDSTMSGAEFDQYFYLGAGNDLMCIMQSGGPEADRLVCIDDTFFYTSGFLPTRYVRAPIEENPAATYERLGASPPIMFLSLRYDRPQEEIIRSLAPNIFDAVELSGYRTVTDDEGRSFEQITLISELGHAAINVDPETKFVASIETQRRDPSAPVPFTYQLTMTFNPVVTEQLPTEIGFHPERRVAVPNFADLQRPVWIGDLAPDFTLPTIEGDDEVTLSDLRGSVVVLDFWATWCMPCRRGLPLLDEFAAKAGKGVQVYAVNTLETGATAEDKLDRADGYWSEQDFSIESLIDTEGAMAEQYGARSVPLTIVIDPQGVIRAVHTRFHENMVEMLQKDVAEAFGTS